MEPVQFESKEKGLDDLFKQNLKKNHKNKTRKRKQPCKQQKTLWLFMEQSLGIAGMGMGYRDIQ